MNRTFAVLIGLLFIGILTGYAQTVKPGDTLTAAGVVELALANHPSIRAAEASVRSAEAGVTQAVSGLLPSVSASAAFTRNGGAFIFNPSTPVRNQTYNNYTTGFSASYTLFDFGKTINRVSASNRLDNAAETDYTASRQIVIQNALIGYYSLMQANQVTKANEEAYEQASRHLSEAKAFYSVGKRAQIDVTKAEVDLANANVNMIRARNQQRIARLQLLNAIGLQTPVSFAISDSFRVEPYTITLDTARNIALAHSPEFLSARSRLEAARSLQTAAWQQNLPTVSASGAYNWSNFEPSPLFSRWNAALTVSLPIFQGFSISAQTEQARAATDQAQANLDLLTQSIGLDVEQNYLNQKEAWDRIEASSKLVAQAEENLRLADRQFVAGVGTSLEVNDALLTLTNARITRIQALFDYTTSVIRLQRAMGTLTGP